MRLSSELTWERFVLDLELLLIEDSCSLAPLALSLNQLLHPDEAHDQCQRSINFMCYELMARCQDKSEEERFKALIQYFFEEKGFGLSAPSLDGWCEQDLLFKPMLQNKSGAPLPTTLIFLHFASELDLPIHLVQLKRLCILKWVRAGKSCFLNVANQGQQLTQEQLLSTINKSKFHLDENGLEILPSKKVFLRYAEELSTLFKNNKDLPRLMLLLNTRLVLEPNNLELLGERALLRQKMGFIKEALADLKRYFSFIDKDLAPTEIQMAFTQMQQVAETPVQRGHPDFLH